MISRNTKWGIVLVMVLFAAYIIVFFLTQHHSDTGVIKIYFADRVTAAHKILIDQYNQKMKGKVEVVPIDFPNFDFSTNERKEILARSLRGTGDGIDLFAVDVIWVQRFAKWCEPLDQYLTDSEKSRLLEAPLKSCYYKGELVALPLDFVQGVMYYREDLLKNLKNGPEILQKIKRGITWEEFIQIGIGLKLKNPFYIFPAADYEGLICIYMDLILGLNPNYFSENGFNLDTPQSQRALQLLVDLVNKHRLTPSIVTTFTEIPSYKYYIDQNGLFIRGWQSYDKDFMESPVDPLKEKNLIKAQIPYFANANPATVIGGWHMMISKFSDKKKEVVDFVKFLLSDEAQEMFYKESGYYPVVKKFYEDPHYQNKYKELIKMRGIFSHGVHRPAHEEYTRFSKIMSYYFEEAIKQNISVKEALSKATHAIQKEETAIREM